jgi:hypothetical protein
MDEVMVLPAERQEIIRGVSATLGTILDMMEVKSPSYTTEPTPASIALIDVIAHIYWNVILLLRFWLVVLGVLCSFLRCRSENVR